jgi:uncharacterized membrane protein
MTIGPVQMLVLGFSEPEFTGKIAAQIDTLREHDFVRILDALVVSKDESGDVTALQVSDLTVDEAMELGAIAGALIGLGVGDAESGAELGALEGADGHIIPDEEMWFAADAIPPDSAAVVLLIEHKWAIPLRDSIVESGGVALVDEWIHPADLVAVGLKAAAG